MVEASDQERDGVTTFASYRAGGCLKVVAIGYQQKELGSRSMCSGPSTSDSMSSVRDARRG
jgi:hypothetical protein